MIYTHNLLHILSDATSRRLIWSMDSLPLNLPAPLARLLERAAPRAPAALALLFVALIAMAGARLFWTLFPAPATPPAPPPLLSGAPVALASQSLDPSGIAQAHLFGDFAAPPVANDGPKQVGDAPDTRLNLKLLGILAGDQQESRALIGTPDGKEEPYSIGQDVVTGAVLKEIYADRVILFRAGKPEALRLDKNKPSTAVASDDDKDDDDDSTVDGDDAQELADIRDKLLSDPSKASQYIRIQPSTSGGQMRGYRIYPGRDRSVFTAAGLRPGDLVTSVNGTSLDDPARALQMLGDLSQANNLTLQIERGGQQQTVNISLQ